MEGIKIIGVFKYADCIIKECLYTYQTGQSAKVGNCLNINLLGIGTLDNTIAPKKPDGFSVDIPLPENILTIGQLGLLKYIENELQQYKITY